MLPEDTAQVKLPCRFITRAIWQRLSVVVGPFKYTGTFVNDGTTCGDMGFEEVLIAHGILTGFC